MRSDLPDRATCLVVGGSSGIGLATAVRLSEAGHHLRLVSRDPDALAKAGEQCRTAGAASVRTAAADVNDRDELTAAIDDALSGDDELHFVVHTATVMGYGRLEDLPENVFRTVVDTAIHGTFNLANAVLPRLRQQNGGVFVVVNSLLGSITVPNMGAYSVSKWGQRAVARTLQQELRGSRVRLCIASPGSINTPIYYQAANYVGRAARPPIPVLQPEHAGRVLADLLRKPRSHVSIPLGPANPVVIMGYRFLPWLYDRIVGPMFRIAALTRKQPVTDGTVVRTNPAEERVRGHWPRPR